MTETPGPRASRPPEPSREASSHKAWHSRGYLPHFDGPSLIQVITFRLADSLPKAVYDEAVRLAKDNTDRRERLDAMIDSGRGACLLNDPAHAIVVRDALFYFDGHRYRLLAWVIMPNHVHVLVEQMEGHRLGAVVGTWKSFTARRINQHRGTNGQVWAPDYHDRFIRDARHFRNAIDYIGHNPVNAGLVSSAGQWPFSSASTPI